MIKIQFVRVKIEFLVLLQKFWIIIKKYAEKKDMHKLKNFVMIRYFCLSWKIKFLMKDLKFLIDNELNAHT